MELKKFNCCICGKEEDPDKWLKDFSEKLVKHQMCFNCNHWREQYELDHTIRGKHNYAIIDGTHYVLEPHTDSGFRGFGGRKFVFEFNDGTVKECDNVWCQGDITEPHWRELMPDNAVIRE